jgi:hypothetical protein
MSIPPDLGYLSELEWLLLRNNNLEGSIPQELARLDHLINLDLAENPDLTCWETFDAWSWSFGIPYYDGPVAMCGAWLPLICSAN